jgi:hypothetical protein
MGGTKSWNGSQVRQLKDDGEICNGKRGVGEEKGGVISALILDTGICVGYTVYTGGDSRGNWVSV